MPQTLTIEPHITLPAAINHLFSRTFLNFAFLCHCQVEHDCGGKFHPALLQEIQFACLQGLTLFQRFTEKCHFRKIGVLDLLPFKIAAVAVLHQGQQGLLCNLHYRGFLWRPHNCKWHGRRGWRQRTLCATGQEAKQNRQHNIVTHGHTSISFQCGTASCCQYCPHPH